MGLDHGWRGLHGWDPDFRLHHSTFIFFFRMSAGSIEQGSTSRWSGLVQRRTMCGTSSPAKPIGPTTGTTAAVASEPPKSPDVSIFDVACVGGLFYRILPTERRCASPTQIPMSKLVVISEEMKGRTFELTEDRIKVGRLADNQVRLEDKAVSSYHAELLLKGGDYIVHDLNSTNGTRVNGQRIIETRLCHGDMVNFGHLELQYFSSGNSAPQPLPSSHRKTVDLTQLAASGITSRPTSYRSASPYEHKKNNGLKMALQIAFLVLGLLALILLAVFIVRIIPQ